MCVRACVRACMHACIKYMHTHDKVQTIHACPHARAHKHAYTHTVHVYHLGCDTRLTQQQVTTYRMTAVSKLSHTSGILSPM